MHPAGLFIDFAKRAVFCLLSKQTRHLLNLNIFLDDVEENFAEDYAPKVEL